MEHINESKIRKFNRILAQIDEVYHEVALRQGFSDSEMAILYVLSDQEGACLLTELVKMSGENKQTVNSALRKLEKADILYLEPVRGRAKRVCLTEHGFSVAHETADRVREAENRICDSWPQEEWEFYVRLTERYLSQLREEMKEV